MQDTSSHVLSSVIMLESKERIDRVIDRKDFILGEDVALFEKEVAHFLGVNHAIGINSGTDAFRIALAVIGIGRGDEVILPAFCFASDAAAVVLAGGTPVFADIDPITFNLDAASCEAKITKKTKAVIPAHMYGFPARMEPLLELCGSSRIIMIEDACQAFGATYKGKAAGSFGDLAGYSFYPTKPMGAFGDAGLITTDSDEYAERIRMIRNHGSREKYYHEFPGFSTRLDTIQAAVLHVQLKYFERQLDSLKVLHDTYDAHLRDLAGITIPCHEPYITRGYTHYTIRTDDRAGLSAHLQEKGIPFGIYYPLSLHLQQAFSYLGYKPGDLPESERAQEEVLSLPLDINTTMETVLAACEAVREFAGV